MVAIFTAQKELQQAAQERAAGPDAFPDQHLFAAPRGAKLSPIYSGRVRVQTTAGQITFELLDDTWAGIGVVATDEIFVEGGDLQTDGAWTVDDVTGDPVADVSPLDPPASIEAVVVDPENTVGSHSTQVPNKTRGHVDQTLEVVISVAATLTNPNLRSRTFSGFTRHSDNLRQLVFQGPVSGTWIIGDTVTGGTSGAVGTIVGLGPRINQGLGDDAFGFWLVADMGVDYAGAEWDVTTPDVVTSTTGGATGTLKAAPFAGRSTGALFRTRSDNAAVVAGLGVELFRTSGFLEFLSGDRIMFPNPNVDFQNGLFVGDSVLFDSAPVAGDVFSIVGITAGNVSPTRHDAIVVDPSHGASGGFPVTAVQVLYDPNAALELLATGVSIDGTSPSTILITAGDGRTWPGIGVSKGDILALRNSGSGFNNVDLRIANFSTDTNPDDEGFLPGNLSTVLTGPYPDTVDVYRLRPVPPGNRS